MHIVDWEKHFEIAQSRRSGKAHRWVAIPNRHDSRGYRRIMRQKNPELIFTAWMLLVQLASRAHIRGILADSEGKEYTTEDLEILTDYSKEKFDTAIPFLIEIGWVAPSCSENNTSTVDGNTTVNKSLPTIQNIPNTTKQNKTAVSSSEKFNSKPEISIAWNRIPSNRQQGIGAFRTVWIQEITRTDVDPLMVGDKLEEYYKSPEGKGKYWRKPATLISDEFWNEGSEIWKGRDAPNENVFPECTHAQAKIIKDYCDESPAQLEKYKKLSEVLYQKHARKRDDLIARQIWRKNHGLGN